MKLTLGSIQLGHDGCSDRLIDKLESRFGVQFPSPYRRFLSRFGQDNDASSALRGSDYYVPLLNDLRTGATELLRENGASLTLHPRDFVFMMHQGYMFWFFRADGTNDDPEVFRYTEPRKEAELESHSLIEWLKRHEVFVAPSDNAINL